MSGANGIECAGCVDCDSDACPTCGLALGDPVHRGWGPCGSSPPEDDRYECPGCGGCPECTATSVWWSR